MKSRTYISRAYWKNYIDTIISSIQRDEDTIINMLMYGELEEAEILMKLSAEKLPKYQFKMSKIAEKSPFGEEDDE